MQNFLLGKNQCYAYFSNKEQMIYFTHMVKTGCGKLIGAVVVGARSQFWPAHPFLVTLSFLRFQALFIMSSK